jgi:pyruvate dehydrogenase E1 component alpha subunit
VGHLEPLESQTGSRSTSGAMGFGFPGVRVDGNDVLPVLAVTRAALQRAREGTGPTLIEAYTYRMGAHTTSDDPTRYRIVGEVEAWKLKDPIERVKAYLVRNGAADQDFFDALERESDELAGRCARLPRHARPAAMTLFDHVYDERHPLVDEEREQFGAYLSELRGEPLTWRRRRSRRA